MPGLRIRHSSDTDKTIIVPHPGGGVICRLPKDYHIRVGSDGTAIVSETVWKGLQECAGFGYDHGLVFVNQVDNPPAQGVGFLPPETLPDINRIGTTREGSASSIEKMKRSGIIPKGVKASIHKMPPPKDNQE